MEEILKIIQLLYSDVHFENLLIWLFVIQWKSYMEIYNCSTLIVKEIVRFDNRI